MLLLSCTMSTVLAFQAPVSSLSSRHTHKLDMVASSVPWQDDAITVDATTVDLPKISVQRFHETWEWTTQDTKGKPRTYQINYRVEGEGPPLLLVHGFGANLNHFRYNIPALVQAGYKVYALDLLGFGGSEKPSKPETVGFSIELFAQQMVDFMESRNEEQPWILAGNSIGGKSLHACD